MMIYELYGQLAEEKAMLEAALQNEAAEHVRTTKLLGQIASGEIAPARVTVADGRWTLRPDIEPSPGGLENE